MTHIKAPFLRKVSSPFTVSAGFAALGVFLSLTTLSSTASAVTRRVGSGQMYTTVAMAAAAAMDGDVIELTDAVYRGDAAIATFRANNLTLRGVAGMHPVLDVTGAPIPNGKAIWVIQGANTTVENLDFFGARVPDNNGAGIRQEGAGLTVRGCGFRDNQDGVLAGANAMSDIVFEGCSFTANGVGGGGLAHNLYINNVRSLTMRGCYSTAATGEGHLFKSRALRNVITGNRFTLEGGNGSAEMDFPEGGVIYVSGNIIQQSQTGANHAIIWVGTEAGRNPEQRIYFVNNTIINDYMGNAQWFRLGAGITVNSINNLFVGDATFPAMGVVQRGSVMATTGFTDRAMFDYRLVMESTAIDQGVDPGMDGMMALVPPLSYVHPLQTVPRAVNGTIDVGAYEFGAAAPTDAGVVMDSGAVIQDSGVVMPGQDVPNGTPGDTGIGANRDAATPGADGSMTPMMTGGCGCRAAGETGGASKRGAWGAVMLAAVAASVRRRRAKG